MPSSDPKPIRHWWRLVFALCCVALMTGCATKIRNNVTAFHEWPADTENRTYVVTPDAQQADDLEYQSYEKLLRAELARLGFQPAEPAAKARFKVSMKYKSNVRDVLVIEPVADPWYYPYGAWGGPGFGPYRGPQGYYPPGIYYPGDWGPPIVQQQQTRYQMYARELKIVITDASTNRPVYDVTVTGDDANGPLPVAMPYMMQSAFKDFPGPSGVPRVIELEMKKQDQR